MRGTFETSEIYPMTVIVRNNLWVPYNLLTGEELTPRGTSLAAHEDARDFYNKHLKRKNENK